MTSIAISQNSNISQMQVLSPTKYYKQKLKKNKIGEFWKKSRLKSEHIQINDLPELPDCGHSDKGFHCKQLTVEDVHRFQKRFYDVNKVKQDIFILRHCSVSAPKRCRSKDGIQRKSMIIHYFVSNLFGALVCVCNKTFTKLLGVKNGRIKGVINRYIESKKIPTENRGGDRLSKKFHRKFQAVRNYLSNLQGTMSFCTNCGAKKITLPAEQDMRKLWHFYNTKSPYELRVMESYFRNIFIKNFNISFGSSKEKDKDYCNKCFPKPRKPLKKEHMAEDKEDLELKILEMSYPPGEHFLFAPVPPKRDPITLKVWRNGDTLDANENKSDDDSKNNQNPQQQNLCYDPSKNFYNNQHPQKVDVYNQASILQNLLLREPPIELQSEINSRTNNFHNHQTHNVLSINQNGQYSITHHNSHIHSIQNPSDLQMHNNTVSFHMQNDILLQQNSSVLRNGNIFNNNMVNHDDNFVKNIVGSSQTVLDLNDKMCKDMQCNIIHLGNNKTLQDISNMTGQRNTNELTHHSSNLSLKQEYSSTSSQSGCLQNEESYMDDKHSHSILYFPNQSECIPKPAKEKRLFKCVPCKLTFSSQTTHQDHIKRHLDKKTLNCEICNRKFIRSDSFKQHVISHSNIKPHACPECKMSFAHLINLQIHMERHCNKDIPERQDKHI